GPGLGGVEGGRGGEGTHAPDSDVRARDDAGAHSPGRHDGRGAHGGGHGVDAEDAGRRADTRLGGDREAVEDAWHTR
ncbi:hypothetical protein THAOC_01372, partial [Thalassiosira oceanica]